MKKHLSIFLAIVLVVLVGLLISNYLNPKDQMVLDDNSVIDKDVLKEDDAMINKDRMMKKEETSMMDKSESMAKDDVAMTKPGSYEAYSSEKLALADNGDVVLFFRASWCPTCRALDKDIKANLTNIPAGVTILDVDYDNSTALKQKYGVTYQHTLVQVDSAGNQIAKWTGSKTLVSLVANIK